MPGTTLSDPTIAFCDAAHAPTIERCMAVLEEHALRTLIVVPTFAQQRAAVSAWAAGTHGGRPPVVLPMERLVTHLADALLPTDVRRVDDTEASMLLDLAAEQEGLRPGAMGVSTHLLHRLVMEGHTVRTLAERLEHAEYGTRSYRRTERLLRLWTSYDALVGVRGLDRSNVWRAVVMKLREHGPMTLRMRDLTEPVHAMIVRDAVGMSVLEADLMMALADAGWEIAIRWAHEPTWAQDAEAVAARTAVHDIFVRDRSADMATRLVASGWTHVADAPTRSMPQATVYAAATPADEVRQLLVVAKRACLDEGLRPSDICIVMPDATSYEAAVRDMARRAGVPLTGGDRIDLAGTNPGQSVLAACDVIADQWRRADVDRLRRCDLPADVVSDLHELVTAAEAERIPGGHGPAEWYQRLVRRRDVLQTLRRTTDDRSVVDALRRVTDALDALPRCLAILPVVSGPLRAEEFASLIIDTVIKGLGIERAALERKRAADAAMRPCADPEAVRMLEDLARRYAHVLADTSTGERYLDQHLYTFRRMVLGASVSLHDVRLDGVAVLRAAETRGRTWRLVLSPGWVEGRFPSTPRPDGLEEELLPDLTAQQDLDTCIDIVRCVDTQDGRLLVTWPCFSDESEMLPSMFCETLRHCTTLTHTSHDAAVEHVVLSADELMLDGADVELPASQLGPLLAEASPTVRQAYATTQARALSPTRMDAYVSCPYRYFASNVLNVRTSRGDEDRMTPLERGEMMHAIAHAFFREVRTQQHGGIAEQDLAVALRHPVDLREVSVDDAMRMLDAIAERTYAAYESGHTYQETERRVLVGTSQDPGLLHRWVAMEIAQAHAGAPQPAAFEVSIKADVTLAEGLMVPVDVRVDRIDVDDRTDPMGLVVIDYKNTASSIPSITSVKLGQHVQMPIYVVAVDAYCAALNIAATVRSTQYMPFGGTLHDAKAALRRSVISDPTRWMGESGKRSRPEPIDEAMPSIVTIITNEVGRMRSGDLRVLPLKGACTRCEFNEVCRIDVLGTAQPL